MPKISIIIPVYNRQELIKETLDSVLAQTYKNWECIVVDDGSTDNTWSVLEEYAKNDERIKIFKRHRKPKGAPTCRNIGIEKSTSAYLMFLDSDDLLLSFCLENRIKVLLENTGFNFILFPVFQKRDGKTEYLSIINDKNPLASFLNFEISWMTSSPIWSKQYLARIKGWKEGVMVGQDFELHIRALLNTDNSYFWGSDVPDVIQRPHSTGNSITTSVSFKKLVNQSQTHALTYSYLPNDYKTQYRIKYTQFVLKQIETYDKETVKKLLKIENKGITEILSEKQLRKVNIYLNLLHVLNKIPLIRGVFYRLRRFNFPFPKREHFFRIRPGVPSEIVKVIEADEVYIGYLNKLNNA